MRHIAAPSAVYARTENTALPGSRRFTPRHNISACVSRRMQMSDRDIAAQSNGIIYPPPKGSPDTENYTKTPLKSGINQASKRFCAPHNHATPVRTGQHTENAYTPQPTILSIMHRADGIHSQKKRAAHSRYSGPQFKSGSITPVIVKKHAARPHPFVTTPCNRAPKQTENTLNFCKNRPQQAVETAWRAHKCNCFLQKTAQLHIRHRKSVKQRNFH